MGVVSKLFASFKVKIPRRGYLVIAYFECQSLAMLRSCTIVCASRLQSLVCYVAPWVHYLITTGLILTPALWSDNQYQTSSSTLLWIICIYIYIIYDTLKLYYVRRYLNCNRCHVKCCCIRLSLLIE
jgi:hypothetical protein